MTDSALSLLGLCRKAGKLSLGHDAVKASLNRKAAKLCVVCSDASQRLCQEICGLAEKAETPVVFVTYTMADIKQAAAFKAAVFTVDDDGFSKAILKKINDNQTGKERGL